MERGVWTPSLPWTVTSPPPPILHSGAGRAGEGGARCCASGVGAVLQDLAGRPRPLTGRLLGQEVPTIAVASEGKASERAPGKSSLPGPHMVHNSGRSECSGARRPGTVSAMPSGVQGPPLLSCALLSATAQALHLRSQEPRGERTRVR